MSNYSKKYINRWINCLFPVLTLCALYCFFIPIGTIQDNQRFLNVTPGSVWKILLLITLGLVLISSLIVAIFRKKVGMVVVSLIAGVVLASFVQMLFLDTELGVLNGSYPAWKEDNGKIILNAVIWVVLIALPVVISLIKNDFHSVAVTVICLAVFASQAVSVGSVALSGKTESLNDSCYVLDGKEQYTVSDKNNILVFSLDTLSKDIFETILETDSEVKDGLRDFTHYSNVSGSYTTTFPSLVGMLTGTEYQGNVPYMDYFSDSWNSDFTNAFYPALHDNGYKANIFVDEHLSNETSDLLGKADNLMRAQKQVRDVFYPRILRTSLYRLLPYCLKEYALITREGTVLTADFLNKAIAFVPAEGSAGYESIKRYMDFYEGFLQKGMEVDHENSIFSWTHMLGAHAPYYTNSRGEFVYESTAVEQGAGYLYALEQFFEAMKESGVYDNSTIIITADHGVDPEINKDYSLFVPIIVKLPNETHDSILENKAPISLYDLSSTLLSFVDQDVHDFGPTIFEYEEGEERERVLRRLSFLSEYQKGSWTDDSNGEYNAMETYRFIGGQDTLNQKIDAKDYTAIPLVDSFY